MMFNCYNERDLGYFAGLIAPVLKNRDAQEVTRSLLVRYGTIENLLCADSGELSSLIGDNAAAVVKLLAAVTARRVTDAFVFGKIHTRCEIADYLKGLFLGSSVERVYLLSLDGEGRTLACDLVGVGTVNMSEILPRKILEAGRRAGARTLIIAHNHPAGNVIISDEDIKLTSALSAIVEKAGMKLSYHCIVAGQSCNIFTADEG